MASTSAAMSGPSMRRATTLKMRSITVGLVLAQLLLHQGLFLEQVVVEDLTRDRCRGRPAVAAVLHQQRDRDLRVVGRRVGDEDRVVAVRLLHALLVVLLALLHADHLRGAGLGG